MGTELTLFCLEEAYLVWPYACHKIGDLTDYTSKLMDCGMYQKSIDVKQLFVIFKASIKEAKEN